VAAALSVLLAAAALRELAAFRATRTGSDDGAGPPGRFTSVESTFLRAAQLGVPERLRRAGMDGRFPASTLMACKAATTASGALLALAAAPAAPGRLALVVGIGIPVCGFFGPDAVLEQIAAKRSRRLLGALPDALDLLAVSASSGRSPAAGFSEIASVRSGPLARELGITVAEIACGVPQARAIRSLRKRVSGSEIATVCSAIERSLRFGSPLADQLRRQAGTLRRDQRRAVEERAARAAPKIQLVVALVLVPSVLLMIVAGLIANSDRLLGGLA